MDIHERLDKLERQSRRLKMCLAAVCIGGLVALVLGQATRPAVPPKPDVPDVIRARRFEAVDGKGEALVTITTASTGPAIYLQAPVQQPGGKPSSIIVMRALPGRSDLELIGREGSVFECSAGDIAEFRLSYKGDTVCHLWGSDQFPSFVINNLTSKSSITLDSGSTPIGGSSQLCIDNGKGSVFRAGVRSSSATEGATLGLSYKKSSVFSLGVNSHGSSLCLSNPENKSDVSLDSNILGGNISISGGYLGGLSLADKTGKTFCRMGRNKDGGHFALDNKIGKTICAMGSNAEGDGVLRLSDKTGKITCGMASGKYGGSISVHNRIGKPVCMMWGGMDGGKLALGNKTGKTVCMMGSGKDGGEFALDNKTGESVCTMTVDEYGNGKIGAWDRKGMGRTLKPGP